LYVHRTVGWWRLLERSAKASSRLY